MKISGVIEDIKVNLAPPTTSKARICRLKLFANITDDEVGKLIEAFRGKKIITTTFVDGELTRVDFEFEEVFG